MNCEAVTDYLVRWLREKVERAGAQGVVLGISGGVDSAVAGVIAKQAFPDNCMGVLLPCESEIKDIMDARRLAEEFSIPYEVVELDDAFSLLVTELETFFKLEGSAGRLIRANIKPRLRMLSLYYFAQAQNYLVIGASNKSELLIGYTTKYGDSAVDLQLLGDLRKEEIYKLADYLGIPDFIIQKPPSAGLWSDQRDEEEMGFSYRELDDYINNSNRVEPATLNKIHSMIRKSEHKRQLPPIANISAEQRV